MSDCCRPINILLPARSSLSRIPLLLVDWRGILVLLVALLLGWRFFAPGRPIPQVLVFSLLGLVILVAIIQRVVAWRRARRMAGRADREVSGGVEPASPRPALRDVLSPGPGLERLLAGTAHEERLIEQLSKSAFSGEAVCMSSRPQRLLRDFEPLAVPFEPMLLDAASARLLKPLEAAREARGSGLRDDVAAMGKLARQVVLVLRRTGVFEGVGFIVLVSLVFSLFMGGPLHRRVLSNAAIIGVWVFVFLRRERVAGHLYVIPGGLIDARRKHVYRRNSGLIVWCADSCLLNVIDSGSSPMLSFTVTPAEALVALRAWLSPLPGPSDELIASFLGGPDSGESA